MNLRRAASSLHVRGWWPFRALTAMGWVKSDEWIHIVATKSRSGRLTLYVNGEVWISS